MTQAREEKMQQVTLPYLRVYTDENGESQFVDEEMTLHSARVHETRIDANSDRIPVRDATFREIVEEDAIGFQHNAPDRVFLVHLQGAVDIVNSSGETRRLGPGSIALMEDVDGKGHTIRKVGSGPRVTVMLRLA